eukprot:1945336-Pleurochrysis_carterae.AAC.1
MLPAREHARAPGHARLHSLDPSPPTRIASSASLSTITRASLLPTILAPLRETRHLLSQHSDDGCSVAVAETAPSSWIAAGPFPNKPLRGVALFLPATATRRRSQHSVKAAFPQDRFCQDVHALSCATAGSCVVPVQAMDAQDVWAVGGRARFRHEPAGAGPASPPWMTHRTIMPLSPLLQRSRPTDASRAAQPRGGLSLLPRLCMP